MKKTGVFLSLLVLSACAGQTNLGDEKIRLRAYADSGAYQRDVAQNMNVARGYIAANAGKVENPAIVLDIDETALSNYPQLAVNDFSFLLSGPCDLKKGPCGIKEWQRTEKAKAFPATLRLYRTALDLNVAVFFITGRDETVRVATESNLRRAGYSGWKKLILRPAGTKTNSAVEYKAPERAKIEAQGYTIIANIGDQPSDLAGGYAKKTFLIANPFYRLP